VNILPNIKSAIKRVKVTETKTLKNTMRKSALKTSIKKCKEAIAKGEGAAEAYKATTKALDKAAAKKLLHKNTAARRKSRLAKAMNAAAK